MAGKMRKISLLSVVVLSAVAWGCDQVTEPSTVELAPAADVQRDLSGTDDLPEDQYNLVEGGSGYPSTVRAVFGTSGGRLTQDGHQLIVPVGAVTEPTEFRLTLWANGYIGVNLTALRFTATGDTIDVGAAGFEVPVSLTLSYKRAKSDLAGKEDKLHVVWMKEGADAGTVEWQYSHVDKRGKKVNASLDHFSQYGLAWP